MIEEKGEPAELGWPGSRRPARVGARAREGGAWAEKASGGQEPPDGGGGAPTCTRFRTDGPKRDKDDTPRPGPRPSHA